jgi:hypothetical protein
MTVFSELGGRVSSKNDFSLDSRHRRAWRQRSETIQRAGTKEVMFWLKR